jgi:lipid-A-disaccharide synthase
MKYYIIAGEASGDLHGSNLIKGLKKVDKNAQIQAWGGDLMEESGALLRKNYRDLAFMGFVEVVKNIRTISRNIDFCKKDIESFQPDVVIFIDYPGFNLRIAKWAKSKSFRTFYYISPQIWAWHTSRVHGIKATVDKMFCILPFEKAFYKTYDYDVDYVGHPLLDVTEHIQKEANFKAENQLSEKPIIAILCGSRKQEVSAMLPTMLSIIPSFSDYQFVIAGASSIPDDFYQQILKASPIPNSMDVKIIKNKTHQLLKNATAALVKSGTSTLEAALIGVPQVVCYKGNALSFAIAKRVVKVKYISLVNLIADKPIVKELIQGDFNIENLILELSKAIENQAVIKKEYEDLRQLLGNIGASDRASELMFQYLKVN